MSRPRSIAYLDELRRELARLPAGRRPGPERAERLVEEAAAHLDDLVDELVDAGWEEPDAEREALARFGAAAIVARSLGGDGPRDRIEEQIDRTPAYRRTWTRTAPPGRENPMSSWFHDLRFALRNLARSPGYALAFVLTLGLGIGANTAIFSVIHGVLLRPLPYEDGERLVYLRHTAELAGVDNALFSVPEIDDYRRQVDSLDGVAEFSSMPFTMLADGEPMRITAGIVTGNYFEVMGLGPAEGRVIGPGDDGEAAGPVAVLTDEFWHRRFGADPGVIGDQVTMDARTVTVVGVAAPAPPYPERTDLYVNMATSPHHLGATMNHDRVHRMTEVFARLAPGATLEGVRREVEEVTRRLHEEYPQAYDPALGHAVSVTGLADQLSRRARPTLLMLLGAAAFVLLIACANVANLTLARVMRRREELAVRASIGASVGALRRQLMVENLVPALLGAAAGCLVAYGAVGLLARYAARYTIRASEIAVDAPVLALAFVVGVAAAVLFARLPRLSASVAGSGGRSGSGSGGRSTAGTGGRRAQRLLVVSQVAVCFVLLVGAGLLLRTLANLRAEDGGLELEGVLTMDVPTGIGQRTGDEYRVFYESLVEGVSGLPGVRRVALGTTVPLRDVPSPFSSNLELRPEGHEPDPGSPEARADFRIVSHRYFETLGVPLVVGRTFDARDHADAPAVVVVNESLARRWFPDRDPVGRRLRWIDGRLRFIGTHDDWRTIVGVVADTADYGLDRPVLDTVYMPFAQVVGASALFVRGERPGSLAGPVTRIVRELDPEQPVENVATLEQVHADVIAPHRLNATLVGGFALLAVLIAAVGVASVLAFSVSSRTRELGIRAALGADGPRLRRAVVRDGVLLVGIGLGVGAVVATVVVRLVRGFLFGVDPTDVPTYAAVAAVLGAVALAASWVPAWRASRVDPVDALRGD